MISGASSRSLTAFKLSLSASSRLLSLSRPQLPGRARCLAAELSRRGFLEASATVLASSRQQGDARDATPAMGQPSEVDLVQAARHIVPPLTADRYKGQAGKIATIGGCREYTGAPYFASISALKVGADLSHVFCTEGAATVIKSYSPELIVHPYLPDSGGSDDPQGEREAVRRGTELTEHWLARFDVMVIGPGLGRDPWVHATVTNVNADFPRQLIFTWHPNGSVPCCDALQGVHVIGTDVVRTLRRDNKPAVIDADGLHILKNNLDLLKGWTAATLTPNHNEFERLADAVGVRVDGEDPSKCLSQVVSKLGGPMLVQKGSADSICEGSTTLACTREGSPRRAGGQGDVLSGTLAAFKAWLVTNPGPSEEAARQLGVPPTLLAAYGACAAVREASRAAFKEKRRSMVAGDVILHLGDAIETLYDS